MLLDRNEVYGNKHEKVGYASFTVSIKQGVFHSCDPVACTLCESFILDENMPLGTSVFHEFVWT
jgi:hypothetical protein